MHKIAAASSASICVWQPIPSKDDEPPQWRGVASIDVGFVPRTMDWSKDGTLFVGGSSLALVTLEQTESDTNWACKVAFHTS